MSTYDEVEAVPMSLADVCDTLEAAMDRIHYTAKCEGSDDCRCDDCVLVGNLLNAMATVAVLQAQINGLK